MRAASIVTRILRLSVPSLVLSLLAIAAWHGTRLVTASPAPVIKIRWNPEVTVEQRAELEQRFQLLRPDPYGPNSIRYDLIDSRHEAIRAIVKHPAVGDTDGVDRLRFTVGTTTGRGRSSRWLWHRFASERAARRVDYVLDAWLLLSVLGFFAWDAVRPSEVETPRTRPF